MAAFVRVEDLIGCAPQFVGLPDGGQEVRVPDDSIELSAEPAPLRKLWGLVLLLAVRDRASSVHYHPWRIDGELAYVVGNVRYVMVPPPPSLAGPILDTARSLIVPRRGFLGRLVRRDRGPVCGSLALDVWGNHYGWEVVIWSSGGRSGAEFFRVSPPVEASPAKPPAADDTGTGSGAGGG